MNQLLAKAFEEASKLPSERQNELARHLIEDLADGNGNRSPPISRRTVTKEDWRRKFEALFSALGGERQRPIGVETLQERMRWEAHLGPDELSRRLIESRDE